MGSDEMVTVHLCFLYQTDDAILVNNDGNLKEGVWLPKSQIDWYDDPHPRGTMIDVVVPRWLLEKKGLEI